MELNREQIISEIDEKIRYAKFINTNAVVLSSKAAQFCLEHAQFYEQKIKELTEQNEKLLNELKGAPLMPSEYEVLYKGKCEENKELTRKLECANLEIEVKERILESYMLQYGTVADKEVWLKKERADTVRKMHSEIEARCIKGGIYPAFVKSTVDQIAKEMVEGV